jgi:hypothetical protein
LTARQLSFASENTIKTKMFAKKLIRPKNGSSSKFFFFVQQKTFFKNNFFKRPRKFFSFILGKDFPKINKLVMCLCTLLKHLDRHGKVSKKNYFQVIPQQYLQPLLDLKNCWLFIKMGRWNSQCGLSYPVQAKPLIKIEG